VILFDWVVGSLLLNSPNSRLFFASDKETGFPFVPFHPLCSVSTPCLHRILYPVYLSIPLILPYTYSLLIAHRKYAFFSIGNHKVPFGSQGLGAHRVSVISVLASRHLSVVGKKRGVRSSFVRIPVLVCIHF